MKAKISRLIFFAAAFLTATTVLVAIISSLAAGPAKASFSGDIQARIDATFALLPNAELRGPHSDGALQKPAPCSAAAWPNIPSACLVRTDGSASGQARIVRIVY